jgi:glycolate oxidase FAD binding subunit
MSILRPADAAEAGEAIAQAAAEGRTLEIVAGGSKRALGRPQSCDDTLDASRLAGIVDYDPSELVLTARPATPMRAIAAALAETRQMLAFEPPDWRALLGRDAEPTLGGTIACNLAGPRRVRAGAARDHFLGFSAVNGWGDAWKGGGRVVKNVTGYDLCKLQAGAFGTLSLLTEVTVRVLPLPETARTLLLRGLDPADAIAAMARALNAPHEVSSAAHLPAASIRRSSVSELAGAEASLTALRVEGPAPSVAFRMEALRGMLDAAGELDAGASAAFWTEIGAVAPLLPAEGRLVWRVCPTPSRAHEVAGAVRARLGDADALYDWGGGLLWLSLDPAASGADAGAAAVRDAVRAVGGHATLVVAPDAIRAAVPVFEPQPAALDALAARVKAGFDPRGILNPRRMHESY